MPGSMLTAVFFLSALTMLVVVVVMMVRRRSLPWGKGPQRPRTAEEQAQDRRSEKAWLLVLLGLIAVLCLLYLVTR